MSKLLSEIIEEIRSADGLNAKKDVLRKYQDNQDFKTLLKLAYDPRIKYWITHKQVTTNQIGDNVLTRQSMIEILNPLAMRKVTGNAAKEWINQKAGELIESEKELLKLILKRDLRISLNRKSINSVFGDNFVFDPPYMRCKILNESTKKNIKFPAYVQLKADGMFVNLIHRVDKENNRRVVELMSRQGERLFVLESILRDKLLDLFSETSAEDKDFVLHCEILIDGIDDRKVANGILNRDEIPGEYHDKIYFMAWDAINYHEWIKRESKVPYEKRFKTLVDFLENYGQNQKLLRLIPTTEVNNFEEVFQIYQHYTSQGLEGVIVKNKHMIYKHHDSPDQLKVKVIFEVDLEIIGFKPGTGKFEKTFGSLIVKSSEGLLVTKVSGMTDAEREYLWEHRDDIIGKIVEIEGNDLFPPTKDNPYWTISHPRYKSLRTDKTEADSLERIKEIVDSAKMLNNS